MSRLPRAGMAIAVPALIAVLAVVLGLAEGSTAAEPPTQNTESTPGMVPLDLLRQPIPDTSPNAEQLRRGQYLVAAGDCMSCHMREGGAPLAGGLALKTPFGVIYTPNITSDQETGIGGWSADQFYQAMHQGIDDEGSNLYPAFPYPWYTLVSREDDDAILAFLKNTPPVKYTPPDNSLVFPLRFRFTVKGWNLLYFNAHGFSADPSQSPEWNRGAYLVNGLGHCGGCHTPKGALGADKSGAEFHGGTLDSWVAPDLTANDRTGLGAWSIDDVTEYLGTGRNAHAGAGGAMAEVITYSTSLMTDTDRHAMAVYLKSLPASPSVTAAEPEPGAMRRGAAIYSDACASCHLEDGVGQPRYFPPLGRDAMLQQADPLGLEHLILAGGRIGTSVARPSAMTMPSFAWKLTDEEVSDVSTFIRNSWGNRAAPVTVADVRAARKKLNLDAVHLTANSGDQN